ncbi:MAG TPA: hypothetical protein VLD59_16685 [Steroidobacteraceae bacterium]|nr:hypothetical protein [Steroidobacteraceae bacterium]
MASTPKTAPTIAPASRSLAETFAAFATQKEAGSSLIVTLSVRGGPPAKAYRLEFVARGDGNAHCQYECRLTHKEGTSGDARLSGQQLRAVFGKVAAVLALPEEQPRFLPDTLIGILDLSDGITVRRFYFAADADQAKTQGKVPPPALKRLVDSIYVTAAALTKQRSVKP